MSTHQAAFLDKVGAKWRIGKIDTPTPTSDQVLVRVKAIAINPVDWKVQDSGYFLKEYPSVLGEDVAGTIEAVGDSVTRFKKGERVIAHCSFLASLKNQEAGFQEIVVVNQNAVCAIPEAMKTEEAVVLPLAISTASAGLYQKKSMTCLELPLPQIAAKSTGKTLLVWGGSSSVGVAAIQLARASGVEVVTTCSKRNFELVEGIGAKAFDYSSPGIVGDLVAELQKGEFAGAYDAIGTEESTMQTAQVVASFGGGIIASVLNPPEGIPATVEAKMVFALTIFGSDNANVGKGVWQDFLPEALESGLIKPLPKPEVVGHGLEALEEACQIQKKGVSAKKIVVTL